MRTVLCLLWDKSTTKIKCRSEKHDPTYSWYPWCVFHFMEKSKKKRCLKVEGMNDPQSEDRPPKKIRTSTHLLHVFIWKCVYFLHGNQIHTMPARKKSTKPFFTICIQLCVLNWAFGSTFTISMKSKHENHSILHMMYRLDMWHERQKLSHGISIKLYFKISLHVHYMNCCLEKCHKINSKRKLYFRWNSESNQRAEKFHQFNIPFQTYPKIESQKILCWECGCVNHRMESATPNPV